MAGFLNGKIFIDNSVDVKRVLDEQNHTTEMAEGKSIVNVEALTQEIQDAIGDVVSGVQDIPRLYLDTNNHLALDYVDEDGNTQTKTLADIDFDDIHANNSTENNIPKTDANGNHIDSTISEDSEKVNIENPVKIVLPTSDIDDRGFEVFNSDNDKLLKVDANGSISTIDDSFGYDAQKKITILAEHLQVFTLSGVLGDHKTTLTIDIGSVNLKASGEIRIEVASWDRYDSAYKLKHVFSVHTGIIHTDHPYTFKSGGRLESYEGVAGRENWIQLYNSGNGATGDFENILQPFDLKLVITKPKVNFLYFSVKVELLNYYSNESLYQQLTPPAKRWWTLK